MISGVSTSLQRLAEGMKARGHSILVIAASPSGNYFVDESNGMKVVGLPSHRNPMAVNQRFMLWQKKMMAQELETFSPDLIHIHDPLFAGLCGLLFAKRRRIPIVFTVHLQPNAVSLHFPPVPGLKSIIESATSAYGTWLLEQCDAVVAPSQTVFDAIKQKRSHGVHLISNGVDTGAFRPTQSKPAESRALRRKFGIPTISPIILHVGRISKEKQIETIIQISAKAMRKTDAQLLVVGDGPGKRDLLDLCDDLGISDRCHFPGFVQFHEGLPAIYRMASVFVMASEVEAQGLTVLEAAASGLPILAFNASAMTKLVEHKRNGFLILPGQINEMSERLTELLAKQLLRERMGRAGREKALAHSHELSIAANQELYHSFVEIPETIQSVREEDPPQVDIKQKTGAFRSPVN